MRGAASDDLRDDATDPQESAILAEVVASVGVQAVGLVAGTAALAPDVRNRVQERDELGGAERVHRLGCGAQLGEVLSTLFADVVYLGALAGAMASASTRAR